MLRSAPYKFFIVRNGMPYSSELGMTKGESMTKLLEYDIMTVMLLFSPQLRMMVT